MKHVTPIPEISWIYVSVEKESDGSKVSLMALYLLELFLIFFFTCTAQTAGGQCFIISHH